MCFRRVLVGMFPLCVVSCAASARRVCCLVCALVCFWVVVFVLFTSVRVCLFACVVRPLLTRNALARRCGYRRVPGPRKFPCVLCLVQLRRVACVVWCAMLCVIDTIHIFMSQ